MRKILAISILLSMILVAIPTTIASDDCIWDCNMDDENQVGNDVVTKATVVDGSGGSQQGGQAPEGAPIIKCKWEYDLDIELPPAPDCCDPKWCKYHDACPFQEGLQIHPDLADVVQVGFFAIVTDEHGPDHVEHVYADVWHPDGEYKYQVELYPIQDPQYPQGYDKYYALEVWDHLVEKHHSIITYGDFTFSDPNAVTKDDDIRWELEQDEAYLYYNWAYLSYCQPAGEYCVIDRAVDGLSLWSDCLSNKFWYIPTAAAFIDFNQVQYGNVVVSTWNPAGGDLDMKTSGLPTVQNVGNTPIYFKITQSDMKFGKTNEGTPAEDWNVEFMARLTDQTSAWTAPYDPFVATRLPGVLGLCKTDKFDFKIHVKKGLTGFPETTGWMKIYCYIDGEPIWYSDMQKSFGDPPYYLPHYNPLCSCGIIIT